MHEPSNDPPTPPPGAPAEAPGRPPRRAAPRDVERRLRAGHELLLVCAYEADASHAKFALAGAVPRSALERQLAELEPDHEIVFYCRCPDDATAEAAARELAGRGFTNVGVLAGGVRAWRDAGLPSDDLR